MDIDKHFDTMLNQHLEKTEKEPTTYDLDDLYQHCEKCVAWNDDPEDYVIGICVGYDGLWAVLYDDVGIEVARFEHCEAYSLAR